jgi:hypothetical protein
MTINKQQDVDIELRRINTLKEQTEYLIKRNDLNKNEGYFKYNARGFQSFFLGYKVDLVFVNRNNRVIKIMEGFKENKISDHVEDVKFLYILPSNFVKKYDLKTNDVIQHNRIIKRG